MRKRIQVVAASMTMIIGFTLLPSAHAANPLPQEFYTNLNNKYLINPSVLIVNRANMEVVFDQAGDKLKAPASTIKLVSAVMAAMVLDTTTTFNTAIYSTEKSNTFTLISNNDPWVTSSLKERDRSKRTYLPQLVKDAIAGTKLKKIYLNYSGIEYSDIRALRRAFGRKLYITAKAIPASTNAMSLTVSKISESQSPQLQNMLKWCLLYSDNVLAQRLMMLAVEKAGFAKNKTGMNDFVIKQLSLLGVNYAGLYLVDGSGLSSSTQISPRTLVELLFKIRTEPKLQIVYDSLPTSGESGTLVNRFNGSAAEARGLVKAKTGSTRHTVALAGFASAKDEEYVFAIISNNVSSRKSRQDAARAAIDRMLSILIKTDVKAPTPEILN